MQIVLSGQRAERAELVRELHEFCQARRASSATLNAVDVALEEHLTNVFSYGERGTSLKVVVSLTVENGSLCVSVEDDGEPFNPLARPAVDTSMPLAEKPIGGLGIHLIRMLMDDVSYARESGRNVLRLKKRLKGEESQLARARAA